MATPDIQQPRQRRTRKSTRYFRHLSQHWLPAELEFSERSNTGPSPTGTESSTEGSAILPGGGRGVTRPLPSPPKNRSWRRRAFLLLTEPHTSIGSAAFYVLMVIVILVSNIFEIMQTVDRWQFTPDDCVTCGGEVSYYFDDDGDVLEMPDHLSHVECVCPPAPLPWSEQVVSGFLYFLTAEWVLRVMLFAPAEPAETFLGKARQFLQFLFSLTTIIDAMAIFPYYFDKLPNGLISLRLLRLFRAFQFIKFGKYNAMFTSLTNVLGQLVHYLKLLILVLAFSAAFFGSMLFWLERGTWKYFEPEERFTYVRVGVDGVSEEPSPFSNIPNGLWWFMVTSTTVGYGDYYPTTTPGKWCATVAMLIGILVVAFPVSVFSDLWSQELKRAKKAEQRELARKRGARKLARRRANSNDSAISIEQDSIPVKPAEQKGPSHHDAESPPEERQPLSLSLPAPQPLPAQHLALSSSSNLSASSRMSSERSAKSRHADAPALRSINEAGVLSDDSLDDVDLDDASSSSSDGALSDSTLPFEEADKDSPHIVVEKEDLREIKECLHAIRSNERRVQAILRKYQFEEF